LWLGTLPHSRTTAADDGRIGGRRARAKAEYKPRMASICAPTYVRRTLGERK